MIQVTSIKGLVLAGGHSRRMGRDKADLRYRDSAGPEWSRIATLLNRFCDEVRISVRPGQQLGGHNKSDAPLLPDSLESAGPLSGILSAFENDPHAAWLVVACDLPLLDADVLEHLLSHRGSREMIAYSSSSDGLPEPLCTIYEPESRDRLLTELENGIRCPRKILIRAGDFVELLRLPRADALDNANTPEEFDRLRLKLMKEARSS